MLGSSSKWCSVRARRHPQGRLSTIGARQPYAYANTSLPIGFNKTISQPFIVPLMTDLLDIRADDIVLEIGTGLGYQTAILARLARKVYSIELIDELGHRQRNDSIGRDTPTSNARSAMAIMAGPSAPRLTR